MENSSILSHVSVGTNDYEKAKAFYDHVLGAVGIKSIMEHGEAIAYGKQFPEFWLGAPLDGQRADPGNGIHISFIVDSKELVDIFHKEALAAGATDNGAPGPREIYGAGYYGCFVHDLDGNKIEAMHWDQNA